MTVLFVTQVTENHSLTLASCTTCLFILNLSKNSFFMPCFSKANAKVLPFSDIRKSLCIFFLFLCKKDLILDIHHQNEVLFIRLTRELC